MPRIRIELDKKFLLSDIQNNPMFKSMGGNIDNESHRETWAEYIFFYFLLNRSQFGKEKPGEYSMETEYDWAIISAKSVGFLPKMTFAALRHARIHTPSPEMPAIPHFVIELCGSGIEMDEEFEGQTRDWLISKDENISIAQMVFKWLTEAGAPCTYNKSDPREIALAYAYKRADDKFHRNMRGYFQNQIRTRLIKRAPESWIAFTYKSPLKVEDSPHYRPVAPQKVPTFSQKLQMRIGKTVKELKHFWRKHFTEVHYELIRFDSYAQRKARKDPWERQIFGWHFRVPQILRPSYKKSFTKEL